MASNDDVIAKSDSLLADVDKQNAGDAYETIVPMTDDNNNTNDNSAANVMSSISPTSEMVATQITNNNETKDTADPTPEPSNPQNDSIKAVTGASDRSLRYYHQVEENKEDGFYYLKPKSKHILLFEFKIKRISNIDTSEETFRCNFHYYLTWLASYKDWEKYVENGKSDKGYMPAWIPKISLSNSVDIHERDLKLKYYIQDIENAEKRMNRKEWCFSSSDELAEKTYGFKPWQGRWVRCKYSFEATFAEQFELDNFPFDCQDLSIVVKGDKFLSEIDILPFPRSHSDFMSFDSSFSATGEWTYEGLLAEFSKTDAILSKANKEYATVNISVKSKRNWHSHQTSLIIVFCMFALGLCTFGMDHTLDAIDDRLGFGITLLLADVATMQFIFGNVPNIPYFTLFDCYVHYCFRFLFAILIWCALLGLTQRICSEIVNREITSLNECSDDAILFVDYGAFLVFILAFIACHYYLWNKSRKAQIREIGKKMKTTRELEFLFDQSHHLVLQEKKIMYINSTDWEHNDYLNEKPDYHRERFKDDIICFASTRATEAQKKREKTRRKYLKRGSSLFNSRGKL